jgi:hypothetical protein
MIGPSSSSISRRTFSRITFTDVACLVRFVDAVVVNHHVKSSGRARSYWSMTMDATGTGDEISPSPRKISMYAPRLSLSIASEVDMGMMCILAVTDSDTPVYLERI